MSHSRIERVNELLHREIAASLYRVIREESFDHAAVTIQRVDCSPDLRQARVAVSVLTEDEKTAHAAVATLVRSRKAIQADIYKRVTLKYSPYLKFERDGSVAEGNRVLALLDKLDIPEDPEPPLDPDEEPEQPDGI